MDPSTASYYRAILFRDGQDTREIPAGLRRLHAWAFTCCQALGIGSVISKQSALAVVLTWLSSTADGRAFAKKHTNIGDLFDDGSESTSEPQVDWETVSVKTPVRVSVDGQTLDGEFIGRRSSWLDVSIGGEKKSFRYSQVKLA